MSDRQRFVVFIFLYAAYLYLNAIADFPAEVLSRSPVYPWSQVITPTVALLAVSCMVKPGLTRFMLLIAASLVSYIYRAPSPGNHDLLGFILESSFLATLLVWRLHQIREVGDLFRMWAPVGRSSLLILYLYAVFHKLNMDYFNPALSCGSVFVDLLRARPLSFLPEPGPFMRYGAILGSLVAETLIPVFLCLRGRALFGILLGTCFHFGLGYHFFWHFTPMLFALYFLFVPAETLKDLKPHLSPELVKRHLPLVGILLGCVILLEGESRWLGWHSIQPWFVPDLNFETAFGWFPFLILSYTVVRTTLFLIRHDEASSPVESLLPSFRPLLVFPLVVLVVGTFPYLGYSSMLSFTMFSGLRTENGISNHVWIPASAQISDNLGDVVQPLAFSPNLLPYLRVMERRTDLVGRIYPWLALRKLVEMAKNDGVKDIQLSFIHNSQKIDIKNAELDPMFADEPSLVEQKLFKFRAGPEPGWAERCAY